MTLPPSSHAFLATIRDLGMASGQSAIDLSLDRIRALLTILGNPQDRIPPVVHVAGTNGKGSTIAFLEAILRSAGARVHCFTSPYLVTIHESIRLAGDDGTAAIPEARLTGYLARVADAMETAPVTPFEAETAAAFLAFADTPADVVLLETGLGGRLDATNVVATPALTVLTPISLDHTEFLGPTVTDIAREKAGILKQGVPVVVGRQDEDAYTTIARHAMRLDVPITAAGREWDTYEQHGRLVFQDEFHLRDLQLPTLQGRHQIDNAGLAVAAALALDGRIPGLRVTGAALETGLASVSWPGRLQRLPQGALYAGLATGSEVWLDGGHNATAATALATAIADLEEATPLPLYMIIAMLASKDVDAFVRPFRGLVRTIAAVPLPETVNATAPPHSQDVIAGAGEANGIEAHAMSSVTGALDWIGHQSDSPVRILICGSLHLAAHVLELLDSTAST